MIEREELADADGASRSLVFSDGGGEVITRGCVGVARPDGRQANPCAKYVLIRFARREN